ncbi:intracellular growth attenuator family protein [Escherichia coli]|nr:intracellular growth attenuator family protein [Escherichia coli]
MALLPRFGRSPPAPFWEQYINDENTVELIHTDSLPLVISLNGHTLQEYMQETRGYALQPVPSTQASIRGEESEQIELLNIRKETHEEYALSRPRGLREALLIVASFLMFFFCLITPDVFVPWLAGGALLLLGAGLWGYSRPRQNPPCGKFIVCAVHPVVGDCLAKTIRNRSTIFHSVLSTWSTPHTGSHTLLRISVNKTDIDIYLDRHVVRQGRYLSLHDEVKTFRYSTGCAVRLSLRARYWCCLCCYSGSRWICR